MLARFLDNTRGGVAPLAAVVALPLMVGVGVAMDYSKVNAARSAFQVALDSTALMLSKDAAWNKHASKAKRPKLNSLFSHPMSPSPSRPRSQRLAGQTDAERHGHRNTAYWRQPLFDICIVGVDLGQYATARCTGARQQVRWRTRKIDALRTAGQNP